MKWTDRPAILAALAAALSVLALSYWLGGGEGERLVAGRLLLGLTASLLIGHFARQRGWLTASGMLGAVLTGTLTFGLGGLAWGALLVAFFLLSSLLSRVRRQAKARMAEVSAKGSQRDLGQVLANGGLGTLLAVASTVWPTPLWYIAFVGTMAAVTADTWSTEIGLLSQRSPRLVTTGRTVAPGTNGAISTPGTVAGALGAVTIGLLALALTSLDPGIPWDTRYGGLPVLALISGMGGGLIDSLLGATVQATRHCPRCDTRTEHRRHACGTTTTPLHGWSWLDNDRVNALAAVAGASIALVFWQVP